MVFLKELSEKLILKKKSADNIPSILVSLNTVCKGYQQLFLLSVWSGSKLFANMMIFLYDFFEKDNN